MDYYGGKYYVSYNEQCISDGKRVNHSFVNYIVAFDSSSGKMTNVYKLKTPSKYLDDEKCELEGVVMVEGKLSVLMYSKKHLEIFSFNP